MNEGMAMYLQGVWQAEQTGGSLDGRDGRSGPAVEPAAARRVRAAGGLRPRRSSARRNVYYGPALMWDELRKRIGDDVFWPLVRDWPARDDNANADYDDVTPWWSSRPARTSPTSSTTGCSSHESPAG